MSKKCIICDKRAGSREHIFPAALGGRRVNKGIYCGFHNKGFSPYAALLSNQLVAINALLGVRPDHSDKPRPLTAINPSDGQAFLIAALKTELASPKIVSDVTVGDVRQVTAHFSTEEQIQKWRAEQKAAGKKADVRTREEGTAYFTKPYNVQLELGGLEGIKAIGYVALTFLAHYFPSIARQTELQAFKDFVLGINQEQSVWWDFDNAFSDNPPNSFSLRVRTSRSFFGSP